MKNKYLFIIAISLFLSGYISFPDYPLVLFVGILIGGIIQALNDANEVENE